MIELGTFKDLQALVKLLNTAWGDLEYRLEPVEGDKGSYLFVEDPLDQDTYECGIVEKKGAKAYALSSSVYELIIGAYLRYKEDFIK
ncbi:hypothetical protein IPG41_01295 [Candidatus Peregrinibacteria bacterium]|nr:MAG: hypothetical protein IPG41_01295 [Candidatus Peregrinibacteria bacterium]